LFFYLVWFLALGYILNQALHNKAFFCVWIYKLKWCWIFWMNFDNAFPNVLWRHLEKFEMNIMSMQYSKAHLNMCNTYFHYLMICLLVILTFVVCHLQLQQPIHLHRFDKDQISSYFLSIFQLNLGNFRI
jgi:hypothetical protein